jgi:UPF0755 protein
VLVGIIALIVAVPTVAVNFFMRRIGVWGNSVPGARVEVVIPKGATASEIGTELETAGVIKDAFGFRIATFLGEGAEDIQAGRYLLPLGMTAPDALSALLGEGPLAEKFVNVTFPEGVWLEDFAAIVGRETHIKRGDFMNVLTSGRLESRFQPRDVDSLEGLLFPSTYQVSEKDEAVSLATRLVEEFERRAASLDFGRADALGLTRYEVIIVASMIEAETFQDSERPKVAAVIYNRLRQGMPLGIDATILYALGEHKNELTESDLEVDSPYNTRLVSGLPPTPIGAPGVESLEAALAPASGDWLYYVLADCKGHHSFSVDYDDFLADKAAYQSLEC